MGGQHEPHYTGHCVFRKHEERQALHDEGKLPHREGCRGDHQVGTHPHAQEHIGHSDEEPRRSTLRRAHAIAPRWSSKTHRSSARRRKHIVYIARSKAARTE